MGFWAWIFHKKAKPVLYLPNPEDIQEVVRASRITHCPQVHQETKACVCIDCPSRGKCCIEQAFSSTGQCGTVFVKGCTRLGKMCSWID